MGWLERRRDSVQPVHSWPCSQITGGLAGEVIAAAIRGAMEEDKPMAVAVAVPGTVVAALYLWCYAFGVADESGHARITLDWQSANSVVSRYDKRVGFRGAHSPKEHSSPEAGSRSYCWGRHPHHAACALTHWAV